MVQKNEFPNFNTSKRNNLTSLIIKLDDLIPNLSFFFQIIFWDFKNNTNILISFSAPKNFLLASTEFYFNKNFEKIKIQFLNETKQLCMKINNETTENECNKFAIEIFDFETKLVESLPTLVEQLNETINFNPTKLNDFAQKFEKTISLKQVMYF